MASAATAPEPVGSRQPLQPLEIQATVTGPCYVQLRGLKGKLLDRKLCWNSHQSVTGRGPPQGTEQVLAKWLQEPEVGAPRRAAGKATGSAGS